MFIDNVRFNGMEVAQLHVYHKYGIQPLVLCRRENHSCVMYRWSKKNVSFVKRKRRKYEKYQKSPLVRGVKLWEMLPEKVQKATTRVNFKSLVKQICKT